MGRIKTIPIKLSIRNDQAGKDNHVNWRKKIEKQNDKEHWKNIYNKQIWVEFRRNTSRYLARNVSKFKNSTNN